MATLKRRVSNGQAAAEPAAEGVIAQGRFVHVSPKKTCCHYGRHPKEAGQRSIFTQDNIYIRNDVLTGVPPGRTLRITVEVLPDGE